ncbi:hypothetical protein BGW36DRAFT_463772 [Talaromyces proteolyticus]|uniref:NACHT domain-containing protein n=1 Tax=Talaromyces proteolyticus TaxID=1131652 RepID=A0AAD4KM75_9EURO|nr:uncharacterized protein BGW36DRAFT_463772 [Talaromyces proteolyticus]KAH8694191.1 hypothetical protein BGW36DRAFT_463772 [Talaromyces proteolyticus]
MAPSTPSHDDYTVAWICALPLEMAAAKAMLDEIHDRLPQPSSDHNVYTLGRLKGHNMVITCLPSGVYGITSAATALAAMRSTFSSLRFALVVGIGGGVPGKTDIRLGDVVVSKPTASGSGVIQYDYGKTLRDRCFQRTGFLDKPPPVLLAAVSQIQSDHMTGRQGIKKCMVDVLEKNEEMKDQFSRPNNDWLFYASYDHPESASKCSTCDPKWLVNRTPRVTDEPYVHYGLIASGNQVMKDAQIRDRIAHELGILCFEMEAAGLMDQLPCLVIRGICDYCDSHKQKQWQGYASLAAAAYAKLLLSIVPLTERQTRSEHKADFSPQEKECLRSLFITDPIEDKNSLKRTKGDRAPGTCEWIMDTQEIQTWLGPQEASSEAHRNILWLYGNPGTGKTTMAITLADSIPNQFGYINSGNIMAYFFCDSSSPERCTATAILRGLLYQVVKQRQDFMRHLLHKFEDRKEKLFDSFDGLWTIFMEIGRENNNGQLYCIIDALDECTHESQKVLLTQIKQSFGNKNIKRNLGINFLITSRPYPEIREYLHRFKSKDLSSYHMVQDDLQILIDQKVAELSETKRYPENVRLAVSNTLQEKAEGTFLWIGIACDELAMVRSRDALKTLQSLPRGLNSLYAKLLETTLENTEKEDNNIILQMLTTVVIARRPLSVAQLCIACGLYEDEDEKDRLAYVHEDIEMCRLIIIVRDGILRLLHKSVKDFLLLARGGSLVNELRANATLASRCIDYLLSDEQSWADFELDDDDLLKEERVYGFLYYAVLYWPEHAAAAQSSFEISPEQTPFFQVISHKRERWLRAYKNERGFERIPEGYSIWHVTAKWGIISLVHYLLSDAKKSMYHDDNWMASDGATPIEEAAKAGHIGMITLLLEKGNARIAAQNRILAAAARNTRNGQDIMALLLDIFGDEVQISEYIILHALWNEEKGEEIIAWLLDRQGYRIQITERIVEMAVSRGRNTERIITLLLDRRGDMIQITDEVLKSVIYNREVGEKIMALLLDRQGHRIQITEDVVKTAAANWRRTGEAIMSLFLDRKDGQVQITEDILKAAASNESKGKAIMKLILDRREDRIHITGSVVKAAASNGSGEGIISLLLDRWKNQIQITESIIEAAADNWRNGGAIMALLLDQKGSQIQMTQNIVKAAASNGGDGEAIMKLIFDQQGDRIQINENIVEAAAANWSNGGAIMALLLDQKGGQIQMTQNIVKAAASNGGDGEAIMKLIFDQQGDRIQINENIVEAAAANRRNGGAIMALLLDQKGGQIQVTRNIVKAAVSNGGDGEVIMKLIFDQHGDQVQITEDILQAAASNEETGEAIIKLILDRRAGQIQITEDIVVDAVSNQELGDKIMALLLDLQGDQIQITEYILAVAASNEQSGWAIMKLILDRHGDQIQITPDIVRIVARNRFEGWWIMTLLLDRYEDQIEITKDIVNAAASNDICGNAIMKLLLDRRGDQIQITEDVMMAAVRNEWNGKEIIITLLQRCAGQIRITRDVVIAASRNTQCGIKILRLLVSREPIWITSTGIAAIWEGFGSDFVELLLRRGGGEIEITDKMVKAAVRNDVNGREMVALLLKLRGDKVEIY